jgi:hypothetical protein
MSTGSKKDVNKKQYSTSCAMLLIFQWMFRYIILSLFKKTEHLDGEFFKEIKM